LQGSENGRVVTIVSIVATERINNLIRHFLHEKGPFCPTLKGNDSIKTGRGVRV